MPNPAPDWNKKAADELAVPVRLASKARFAVVRTEVRAAGNQPRADWFRPFRRLWERAIALSRASVARLAEQFCPQRI